MGTRALAILISISLCLSLIPVLAPQLASTAHADPMEVLNLTFGDQYISHTSANIRSIDVQTGDEIIQFTRPNLVIGNNPSNTWINTFHQASIALSGDLSGTYNVGGHALDFSWDELPSGTSKGYTFGRFTIDDGQGSTISGIYVGDGDSSFSGFISTSSYTGYIVGTAGTGAFSGQMVMGTWSGTTTYNVSTSAETSSGTMTLRRYSSAEISAPSAFSSSASIYGVPEITRNIGASGGSQSADEFVQFTRPKISIPTDAAGLTYYVMHSASGPSTGALSGTFTQDMNSLLIPVTSPPGQGLALGKFNFVDGTGTISGIVVSDALGPDPNDSTIVVHTGYMFALYDSGTTTGAYASNDYYATASGYSDVSGSFVIVYWDGNLYTLTPSGVETPTGSSVHIDLGEAEVTFATVTGAGNTIIISSQSNPGGEIPSNFQASSIFYNISTLATYTAPVTVCIGYNPSTPNPQDLKLFHWNGSIWEDVTDNVDTTNQVVCGQVSSLSWFFIGGRWVQVSTSAPVFPSLYIGIAAAFGTAVLAFGIRRRLVHHE